MRKFLPLLFIVFTMLGYAQKNDDPKVGLVLSGGGAKGLAHIGALKVLEEAGVRVDYIGGTSMGAIIGGLYAAGYSANQLDSIFHATNFNILIQDNIPRSAKTFYEKEDTEKYALTLPFDDFQVRVPSGLSKGQNIYNLMNRLTMHVSEIDDFDNLPIPFFCVAADIETGGEVVLDEGSLAKSISASGAIPSLFSPVKIDDRLLTDGGVANNYPVEELRRRGAEIIIGVDVQDSLIAREDLRSVFDILTQINNFHTIADMKEKRPLTDIYIKPDISSFSILSFDEGAAIIDSGRVASRRKIDKLKELAKNQSPSKKFSVPKIEKFNISGLVLEGNSDYPRSYILGKLKLDYDEPYDLDDLGIGINNLSATGNFNKINYQLIPTEKPMDYTLAMQIEESENKTFLRLGLHYDELYQSAALVNLTKKSLMFTNDVVSLDVILGDKFRYNFDYYLDKGYYWSIGLKSRYNNFEKEVSFDLARENAGLDDLGGVREIEVDYKDFTNQFYVQTLFKQVFLFGMGAEHKYLKIASSTINNPMPQNSSNVFENNHYFSTFGYLTYDSYDNKYFPRKGLYFNGDFHIYLLASNDDPDFAEFSIAKGEIGYAAPLSNKFVIRLSTDTGFKVGNDNINVFDFFLGGYGNNLINNFIPFYGYDFISLSGDSYIRGLLELDYEAYPKNHIIASANFANVENRLYTTGNWFTWPDYSGYALGYGLDTFLGPMEVKYTYSPEVGESFWFFSLGFWF
ncbi:patatin-like phospholipase family protein [Gramella jeungdoensis]|uniref:Patatin-like phospholipase family protein n=1 Tax=Gramella jeungdoensis TaxID=708091 RepID=A0ABT0Z2P5_9FLAO|nr:patatin-like phospholipase family protein [Gramella jeungdoensis]MCM8569505.1 patatin-like phospholipase family protein [Gramella jeungdoensis]